MCFQSHMLSPGILISFFKLLSIRGEINFCLDVLHAIESAHGCCGDPLSPAVQGRSCGGRWGTKGRRSKCP